MHALDRSLVPEPACLGRYRHETHEWNENHPTPEHRAEIWQALDAMQRRLCAYCEGPLDRFGQHIEHFRQRNPNGPHMAAHRRLTFAWTNLLGSCDRADSCGRFKDNRAGQYDPDDLIDPTQDNPDHFFHFLEDGTISIRDGLSPREQRRAAETIRVLALDRERNGLPQLRRDAIRSYQARDPGILDALMEFPTDDRRALVAQELAETAGDPFSTVIRHFLEGLG